MNGNVSFAALRHVRGVYLMDEITITLRAIEGVDLEEAYYRLLEWLPHLGMEEV